MSDWDDDGKPVSVWARPNMDVTFRAEIMPGIERAERTYRIETVLSNGRVTLHDFPGEFRETAFEPLNFLRDKFLRDKERGPRWDP